MTGGILGFLLFVIVAPLVVNEAGDLAADLAGCLLRWGARRLGQPGQAERYQEEWLADLERVPGKITKLVHACGVVITSVPRLRAQFRRGRHRAPLSGAPPGRVTGRIRARVTANQQLDAALRQVSEMLVPQFADHCFIDVIHGDVLIRRMQRHASGWTPPPGTWAQTGEQVRLPAGHFCQQAMARRATVLVTDMAQQQFPAPSAPSLAMSMALGITSALAAPLCARGVLLGVISIARSRLTSRTQPNYTTSDRDLFTAAARMAADAIDDAALARPRPSLSARFQLGRPRPSRVVPVPGSSDRHPASGPPRGLVSQVRSPSIRRRFGAARQQRASTWLKVSGAAVHRTAQGHVGAPNRPAWQFGHPLAANITQNRQIRALRSAQPIDPLI